MIRRRFASPDVHALCAVLRHARHALCQHVTQAVEAPDKQLMAGFPALVGAVEAGFRREELVMESLGIPGLRERRYNNALILSALHHVQAAVAGGDPGLGREVVGALRDLLELHRQSADLVLAVSALQRQRRPIPACQVRRLAARRGIAA